jgi:hypothetical protein
LNETTRVAPAATHRVIFQFFNLIDDLPALDNVAARWNSSTNWASPTARTPTRPH